jgi:hypothetical protein
MILVVIVVVLFAAVPLLGGDLMRLTELRLRATWAVFISIALQVLITTVAPCGSPTLHDAIHLLSYGLAGVFVVANRRLPGALLIGGGGVLNLAAITANHGVMPAAVRALSIAGLPPATGFQNSAALAHPQLLALGDIIPVPGPLPNVLSIGDLIIFAGTVILLRATCFGRAQAPQDPTGQTSHTSATPT